MVASPTMRYLTLLLTGVAIALVHCTMRERQPNSVVPFAQLAVVLCLAIILHRVQRACQLDGRTNAQQAASHLKIVKGILFTLLIAATMLADIVNHICYDTRSPAEILLLCTLRDMMVVLAASQSNDRAGRFAVLASLYVSLFAFLMRVSSASIALMCAYLIAGMWWLLESHWADVRSRCTRTGETSLPVVPAIFAIGTCMAGAILIFPITNSIQTTTDISGFFPSSGGTSWHDPRAQGGVGDGDQLVRAESDADSFGPVESELFLESEMPSLYDVINEFSEGVREEKPKQQQRRAIPLNANASRENHENRALSEQPGREFSLVRRSRRKRTALKDKRSTALLQILGRVPLHLGLHAYNHYDGHRLSWTGKETRNSLELETPGQGSANWVRLSGASPPWITSHADLHQLRILNLRTERIPSPPNLFRVAVDHMHTSNLFRFADDGVLSMDLECIPQLSVINVMSHRLSRSSMPDLAHTTTDNTPLAISTRISQLARQWTQDVDAGWSQVDSLCEHLRSEYVLDQDATTEDEGGTDLLEEFLFVRKRGPDYLFASTAAVMLRSLGYEARVRSGFYARSENYDADAGITSVYPNDLHFWVELLAVGSDEEFENNEHARHGPVWITVEPTPGYDVLYAPETLWARIGRCLTDASRFVMRRWRSTLALLFVATTVWILRIPLWDRCLTLVWNYDFRSECQRDRVLATVRLLERRAALYKVSRPHHATLLQWLQSHKNLLPDEQQWPSDFPIVASWVLYGETTSAPFNERHIATLCRMAARSAFRTAARASQGKAASEFVLEAT